MTKYIIYAEDDERPGKQNVVKKIKNNEYEAINFIGDMKNLSRYGCLTLVKKADDDGEFVWDAQNSVWLKMEDQYEE